ncbi:hypothetical protein [Microbacterium sp. YY-01]
MSIDTSASPVIDGAAIEHPDAAQKRYGLFASGGLCTLTYNTHAQRR